MLTEVLIVGVMVGAIYSLVTIGYSMVYGILKLMNFAHGDVYIFGTLLCYTLMAKFHLNPIVAVLAAAIMGGAARIAGGNHRVPAIESSAAPHDFHDHGTGRGVCYPEFFRVVMGKSGVVLPIAFSEPEYKRIRISDFSHPYFHALCRGVS